MHNLLSGNTARSHGSGHCTFKLKNGKRDPLKKIRDFKDSEHIFGTGNNPHVHNNTKKEVNIGTKGQNSLYVLSIYNARSRDDAYQSRRRS